MWSITGDLRLLSVSEKHAISGEIFGKPSTFPQSEIFYRTLRVRVLLVLQPFPVLCPPDPHQLRACEEWDLAADCILISLFPDLHRILSTSSSNSVSANPRNLSIPSSCKTMPPATPIQALRPLLMSLPRPYM